MKAAAEAITVLPRGRKMVERSERVEQAVTDEQVIQQVKKGHREAYRIIVERYKKKAYFLALSWVKNHEDALDLSQEAFVRAFRNLKKYDGQREFFPWFYQLLKNLCFDFLRRRRNRRFVPLESVSPKDEKRGPRNELNQVLWEAIDQLSLEQREVIILRYFQQYSYQEIAELTKMPLGTVMSTLFYAKQKLRALLKEAWGDSSPQSR
jgi:RNA polymerase sigma-70 factor (ECF subfamily)